MPHKLQVVLPDRLAREVRAVSRRRRIPMGQLIREGLEERLERERNGSPSEFWASIRGLASSDETDLSSRVDEIVYGE
ncbi:MAG: hypothetical protein SFV18_06635 [Bryobacteraceae bacterium]|nr:hypothetical protein [Bryobacteraceae bacterium]